MIFPNHPPDNPLPHAHMLTHTHTHTTSFTLTSSRCSREICQDAGTLSPGPGNKLGSILSCIESKFWSWWCKPDLNNGRAADLHVQPVQYSLRHSMLHSLRGHDISYSLHICFKLKTYVAKHFIHINHGFPKPQTGRIEYELGTLRQLVLHL